MSKLGDTLLIRQATLDDEPYIKKLLLEAFSNNDGLHLPFLPTERNVENFWTLEVRPLLLNSDPCLLAFDQSNSIGLSCCSTLVSQAYDLEYKIASGVLTVILQNYRNKGLATIFHQKVLNMLRDLEVRSVITDITDSNKPSFNSCMNIVKKLNLEYNIVSRKYECRI